MTDGTLELDTIESILQGRRGQTDEVSLLIAHHLREAGNLMIRELLQGELK